MPIEQTLPRPYSRPSINSRVVGTAARYWPQAAFALVLALGWQAIAKLAHSPLVPELQAVFQELGKITKHGFAFEQIWITFYRMALGFLLALVLALPIGVVTAMSRPAARFIEPGVVLGLTVPGLVWALLCVIWFGVSLASPVVAVALGVLPSLVITVQHALRSLNGELIEMARVFRLRRMTIVRRLWLPFLYSVSIAGCRVGFSIAWKVIVLVEIFGMSDGVGYQLNAQFSTQNVEGVLAWTLAFWAAMLIVEHLVFAPLDRHANHWKKEVLQ